MLISAVVVAALLFLLWTQSPMIRRGGWRLLAGLFAVALVVVGIAVSIRGEWWAGVPMIVLSLISAYGGRLKLGPKPAQSSAPPPPRREDGMSTADARSILGVAPDATVEDIRAAYTRLMQRAHPDKGGSAGLAAQLNAARDRLLKG